MRVEPRLRAFAALARHGSFTRAADELLISQPAVSKHVSSLERELKTKLVARDHHHVAMTPAGEVLADYVLRAEALLANGRRHVGSVAGGTAGTLAIAASGIPGTYVVPTVIARYREELPSVDINFDLATSGGVLELVRAHKVELGIVGGLVPATELEGEPFVEDEIVLIGPPAFRGKRMSRKDLEQVTWISREEGSATRELLESARYEMALNIRRRLALPSWEAIKLAVAHGAGVAAISKFALALELQTGSVVILDVPRWHVRRQLSVVSARDIPLSPAAERFRSLLLSMWRPSDPSVSPGAA
ncbi:MAG: LysR family transcriptional regulator [Chloroflexi bacterium]|nr:MAG: LysR family transcriptional regulator [Chloroflexota bacterium]